MDEQAFKHEVLTAFEYSYKHDDWVNPLDEALAGVTAEEAAWRPGPKGKGIWDIVLHLAVWNENIVERMKTGEASRPAEGAWPEPSPTRNEAAWQAAQQRLWDSLAALHAYIETNPLDSLKGHYGLGDLFCRFIHNGYHIGQITKMRELRGMTS